MKSSLYEYFNCNSKEELYNKLKSETRDTKRLQEYLEYAKTNLKNEKTKLNGRYILRDYLKNNAPTKGKVQILMLDSQLYIQSDTKININSSFKEIMKKSYAEKARSAILIYHKNDDIDNKIQKLVTNLEIADYKILESLNIDEDLTIFSDITDEKIGTLLEEELIEKTKEDINKNFNFEFTKTNEYHEFMEYYAKNELIGLNVLFDEKKIKEILKLSYQEERQENFGIIKYDNNYNISDIKTLFKGGIAKSTVDPKLLIPILLDEQVKGIQVFHNHPSGNSSPSKEDIDLTENLVKLTKSLDKEILDHSIIAKENIFSFKDEWLIDDIYLKAFEELEEKNPNLYEIREKEENYNKNRFKDEREKFVNDIINSLEQGKIPWEKDWNDLKIGPIHNFQTDKRYQGSNNLKLLIETRKKGYADNRWGTFLQIKNAGWKVKKGEKATTIELFKLYDKKVKKNLDLKFINSLPEIEKEKYMRENVYPVVKLYSVFNGEQIEGIPKLELKEKTVEYDKIDKIIKNSGIPFIYKGNSAFYSPTEDKITIPSKENFKSENGFYATALHELSHATGHESRLSRNLRNSFGSQEYAREELVAELSSVFIMQEKGLVYNDRDIKNSKAYIQNWIGILKNDSEELFRAAKEADKASNMVLSYEKEKTKTLEVKRENTIER